MFKRILVANRGEIALRIIRACRELGIETVAVYSEADRGAAYLELADEAICIGPPKAVDSYLKIDRIISAAEVGNVEAIHPGYGFLAENAHFAEVCRSCNIEFIGPSPEAMALAGRQERGPKDRPRPSACPTCPAATAWSSDEAEAVQLASEIGFPVLIKATAGGGGRGMRVAANDLALKAGLPAGPGRGRGRLRQRRRLPREVHRAPPARRSADPGRPARQRGAPVGTRLLACSGGTRS